ncbi:MAG: hypothetical protein QG671_746 [Actinomycetota bacterium]|jgi:hypothetical protein|nr:hypothetical protein [Actinomycetota bacterium]HQZ84334.1 hypothetical protein [Actinomycetota bacterium]
MTSDLDEILWEKPGLVLLVVGQGVESGGAKNNDGNSTQYAS